MKEVFIRHIDRLASLGEGIVRGLERGREKLMRNLPIKREGSDEESFGAVSDYSLSYMRWGAGMVRDDAFFKALGGVVLIGVGMVTDRMITGVGVYITLKNAKEFYDLSRTAQRIRNEESVRGII